MEDGARHTCLKLEVPSSSGRSRYSIFVRGTWFPSRFRLSITDGLHAWTCEASDADVKQRAEQWDQPVSEYIALAEQYLGFQQPDSDYGFEDAGKGHMRLSWTFEKQGTKLEWRWKCQPSPDSKQSIVEILDFLMDANIRLSAYPTVKHYKDKTIINDTVNELDGESIGDESYVAVEPSVGGSSRQRKRKATTVNVLVDAINKMETSMQQTVANIIATTTQPMVTNSDRIYEALARLSDLEEAEILRAMDFLSANKTKFETFMAIPEHMRMMWLRMQVI